MTLNEENVEILLDDLIVRQVNEENENVLEECSNFNDKQCMIRTKTKKKTVTESTRELLREKICSRERRQEKSVLRKLQRCFWDKIKDGPTYVCHYCEQLWYKESVRSIKLCCSSEGAEVNDGQKWGCGTCVKYLKEGNVPLLSRGNNMTMCEVPDELNLHCLEERLVSLRTPFMEIRELPRGGQLSIKGNVVNVPSDVVTTIKTLPVRIEDSQIIPVKFKRKLSYSYVSSVLITCN